MRKAGRILVIFGKILLERAANHAGFNVFQPQSCLVDRAVLMSFSGAVNSSTVR